MTLRWWKLAILFPLIVVFLMKDASWAALDSPTEAERWAETIADFVTDRRVFDLTREVLVKKFEKIAPLRYNPRFHQLTGRNPANSILWAQTEFWQKSKGSPYYLHILTLIMPKTDPEGHILFEPLRKRLQSRLLSPIWSQHVGEGIYWKKTGTLYSLKLQQDMTNTFGEVLEPGPYVMIDLAEEESSYE